MGDAHSRGPLDRLGLNAGDRVLDIGCGFGETTLQIAAHIRPGGTAVGTDCCEPFLQVARADAAAAGVDNAEFVALDAQTAVFNGEFDVASRASAPCSSRTRRPACATSRRRSNPAAGC